jgi:hypothetical protein
MNTLLELAAMTMPETGARIILACAVMIGLVVGAFYYASKKP